MSWTTLARLASILTARRSSGSSITTTTAPTTLPVRLPMPPKMTTAKTVSEKAKPNTPGVARRSHADSSAPAKAASAEEMPNTATL